MNLAETVAQRDTNNVHAWTEAEIVIIGGGPVGIIIANLLGIYGITTLVVERSAAILDYPRAVGIDDEALRVLHGVGLAEEILRDTISNVPMRMYTAQRRCFADILPTTREFGWYRRNIFSQPLAEQVLRQGLQRFKHVQLAVSTEVTGLEQDDSSVMLTVKDAAGISRAIRCSHVIGADGGRSTVREAFLKIPFDGNTHARKWVVIECDNDPLDAPYTALHCDPARPYVTLRLPYGLRRWEFILFEGEDDEQMLRPEKVHELLRPHVADPAALNIIRARVYTHHSRVARNFSVGRVFLAGDAAHLSPPWIGQGLNAGIRDAANLAWKLAGVVRGQLKPAVLDSYQVERHGHAKAMIDLADQVGAIFALRNRALAWLRDRLLLGMHFLPAIRDYVLQMRFKPMPRYGEGGIVIRANGSAQTSAVLGRMMIQPQVELPDGAQVRFDDACGPWFALVGWQVDPQAHLSAGQREQWQALGARFVMVVRARSGAAPGQAVRCDSGTVVVQDLENLLSVWFERSKCNVLVLRPDRYVAGLCEAADSGNVSRSLLALIAAEANHETPSTHTSPV